MTPDGLRFTLALAFGIALALFISAPLVCTYGAVDGLDGTPVIIDYPELWGSLDSLSGTVYAVGDILCHQESGRSFHLNGSQLPICVRDISALAGLFAGMCAVMRIGRYTSERRFCVPFLIVSFGLMIADVVIQNVFSLNVVPTRVVTGFLCGLSVSFAIDMWFRSFEPRHDE
ncbi:MAG: DUF2085 domain-containing protein [Candidatus Methanomethylophilaceae archaeon]|nr:DUF2085 domain-containing protein [Candidatus Methanomethylophilaceae archaeon]